MSDSVESRPPPPPAPSRPVVQPMAAARPQVVHLVAKPTSFGRVLAIVGGLFLFGLVFLFGVFFGIAGMFASAEYDEMVVTSVHRDGGSQKIAILPVYGSIDSSQVHFVQAAVSRILDDASIRGVVLRVDSPGGGVTESDQIWYEVERLKKQGLSVVASYGGIAASGGYYVSCGADYIMAEETSITGSIGVIAQVLTLEGLFDKVGVEPVTLVATGSPEKSVANDTYRSWTDEDRVALRKMLDAAYDTFHTRVADGRGHVVTDDNRVDELADGSVYTSQEALASGLIDGIGYLDDAIAESERQSRIPADRATVLWLSPPPTLFGGLGLVESGGLRSAEDPGWTAERIRGVVNDLSTPRIMYLMR